MKDLFKDYHKNTDGNFSIMASIFMGALLLVGGGAIEISRMISLKTQLQDMADSAALIGAYSARNEFSQREERVRENIFFNQQGLEDQSISANATIIFNDNTEEVTVQIPTQMPMFFGGILGQEIQNINVESVASYKTEKIDPVTIAFALDVSGSMGWNAGSGAPKIDVLKQSTKILFDEIEAGTPNPDLLPDSIRTGLSAYNTDVVDVQAMNWGWKHLEGAVNALFADGGTNSTPALESAYKQITDDRKFRKSNDPGFNAANHREYVVFMTDGDNNQVLWDEESAQICNTMRNDGIELFSIAFAAPEKGEVLLLDCASWNDGVEKADDPEMESFEELSKNPNDKCAKPGQNGNAQGLANGNNGGGKALGHCTAKEAKEDDKSEYYFDAENAATFKQAFARIGKEIANLTIRTKS